MDEGEEPTDVNVSVGRVDRYTGGKIWDFDRTQVGAVRAVLVDQAFDVGEVEVAVVFAARVIVDGDGAGKVVVAEDAADCQFAVCPEAEDRVSG